MEHWLWSHIFAIIINYFCLCSATTSEFIFRLPAGQNEYYYDNIEKSESVFLEFQVVSGGKLDVDVTILSPTKKILYDKPKSSTGTYHFTTDESGIYELCFDNKFSAITEKVIYLYFRVGDDRALRGTDTHATVLTQMDTYADNIYNDLNEITDMQTYQNLRTRQGRKFAIELNKKVSRWSMVEVLMLLVIGVGQVIILKRFFSGRKMFIL